MKIFLPVLIVLLSLNKIVPQESEWFPEILSGNSSVYLPDFSYAGYMWGEKEPHYPEGKVFRLIDFGALPDDNIDDTEAFQKVLEAVREFEGPAVIELPQGKVIITDILWIDRSNLIIKGKGNDLGGSVIYMPKPMEEMKLPPKLAELQEYLIKNNKRTSDGQIFSVFSWTGGIIWTKSRSSETKFSCNLISGIRGHSILKCDNTALIKAGDVIQIRWFNTEGPESSLLNHVMNDQAIKCGERFYEDPEASIIHQEVTIENISADEIIIKEKLLHDIHPDWKCQAVLLDYTKEVGFEDFSILFPETEYRGHHLEAGYNAFYLTGLLHSWLKNIKIINTDNGILSDDCKNITIDNIEISGRLTHYNVHLGDCRYMLVKDFKLNSESFHTPSFNTGSRLNVFTNGYVHEAKLDQHCGLNHQNLFDNLKIDITNLKNLFEHGGAGYYKPTAAAFNTFWNLEIKYKEKGIPKINDAPAARFIAIYGPDEITFEYGPDAYFEGLNRAGIAVPSLYEYQLKKRLDNH